MTKEQAQEQGYGVYSFANGDWSYIDTNNNWHLYRDSEELTKGVVAKECWSFDNGDWGYRDARGENHRIKN